MTYTVTFYVLRPDLAEIVVSVHHVDQNALAAYVRTPSRALAAARSVKADPPADGFRVVDAEGRIVLDFVDRIG